MKLLLTSKEYNGLHYERSINDIQPHNYQLKHFMGRLKLEEYLKDLKYHQIVGIVNIPNSANICEGYIVYDNINYQGSYMIMD